MAKPKVLVERVLARFAAGTLQRIRSLAGDGEGVTQFIREAVEREIRRREKLQRASPPSASSAWSSGA